MAKCRVRQVNPRSFIVETCMYSQQEDNEMRDVWFVVDKWGFTSNYVNLDCVFTDEKEAIDFAKFLTENKFDKIIYESE